ncbi:hypothetical protein K3757_05910 [Sulfitobacter sp. S223]|uniref:hypothetical protein n=1 Tax=Sulfitobacter sp. S223 TaxID=2867023 RepID=UPI0021A33A0B|nr:hypothetical protein [Sulfitobacter sp. S223]UWR27472.1 hypothetical protein K3757_05910 [Sulfitobacter sp. S223]
MRPTILAALVALAVPVAAQSQTYRAINYLDVVPLTSTTFEVIESDGKGARGIWCAAADYAERKLRYYGRIYISEGRAPSRSYPGRKSVIFTTDVNSLTQEPTTSLTLSTTRVGVGLPANHAIQFCRPADYDLGELMLRRK